MKPVTYEAYKANPIAVLEQVARQARRERAEAVHRFFIAPVIGLFKRTASKPALHLRTRSAGARTPSWMPAQTLWSSPGLRACSST
jgi:hypothetical protein